MANESSNDFAGAVNNLLETLGKLGQMQVDLVTNGIKSILSAVEPLGKKATDLAGGALTALTDAVQNVSSAIAPKK